MRRLEEALGSPIPPIMHPEDESLLNYLQLKNFKDAYKLYDSHEVPKRSTCPLVEYHEVKAYVRKKVSE